MNRLRTPEPGAENPLDVPPLWLGLFPQPQENSFQAHVVFLFFKSFYKCRFCGKTRLNTMLVRSVSSSSSCSSSGVETFSGGVVTVRRCGAVRCAAAALSEPQDGIKSPPSCSGSSSRRGTAAFKVFRKCHNPTTREREDENEVNHIL